MELELYYGINVRTLIFIHIKTSSFSIIVHQVNLALNRFIASASTLCKVFVPIYKNSFFILLLKDVKFI